MLVCVWLSLLCHLWITEDNYTYEFLQKWTVGEAAKEWGLACLELNEREHWSLGGGWGREGLNLAKKLNQFFNRFDQCPLTSHSPHAIPLSCTSTQSLCLSLSNIHLPPMDTHRPSSPGWPPCHIYSAEERGRETLSGQGYWAGQH